jgi:hypothetical protein
MGSLAAILEGPQLLSLINMLSGFDNLGANLFGSLSDNLGGIFGSLNSISFAPAVTLPA